MWMEANKIELIVPNPPYENGVEGLCGNNNGDGKGSSINKLRLMKNEFEFMTLGATTRLDLNFNQRHLL